MSKYQIVGVTHLHAHSHCLQTDFTRVCMGARTVQVSEKINKFISLCFMCISALSVSVVVSVTTHLLFHASKTIWAWRQESGITGGMRINVERGKERQKVESRKYPWLKKERTGGRGWKPQRAWEGTGKQTTTLNLAHHPHLNLTTWLSSFASRHPHRLLVGTYRAVVLSYRGIHTGATGEINK